MNLCQKFQPSRELLRVHGPREENSIALATKAGQKEPAADELSAAELAYLAADADGTLARLYINGELACVGQRWLPGMKEKFGSK